MRKGKGPWMTDVEDKLRDAIEIGIRSSGKAETREYRVRYYTERLTTAKLEVSYYSSMLRLEEQQEGQDKECPAKREGEWRELEEELRVLKLGDGVAGPRERKSDGEEETVGDDAVKVEHDDGCD